MKKFFLLLGCLLAVNVLIAASPKTARFEVRAVVDQTSTNAEPLISIEHSTTGQIAEERLFVEKTVLIDNSLVEKAVVESDPISGAAVVGVTLTKAGGKRFAEVTRAHRGKRLAIVVDGRVIMAPVVANEIPGGKLVISGSFSHQEAVELAKRLNRK